MSVKKQASVADLLGSNSNLFLNPSNNKICCRITGHEMPPRADVISTYLNSKKLQKAKAWYKNEECEQISPEYVVAHRIHGVPIFSMLVAFTRERKVSVVVTKDDGT